MKHLPPQASRKATAAASHTPPNGHVLLVSPLTFSYHEVICSQLRDMGYGVTWWDERASSATWYKLALRMLPGPTRSWLARHFLRLLDALPRSTITQVLVIKGEGLTPEVCTALRKVLGEVPMGFYLWDGLENVNGVSKIVDCFDCAASFDPVDAAKLGWRHRPLFSRFKAAIAPPEAGRDFDWCFIGTLHSDRHQVVHTCVWPVAHSRAVSSSATARTGSCFGRATLSTGRCGERPRAHCRRCPCRQVMCKPSWPGPGWYWM